MNPAEIRVMDIKIRKISIIFIIAILLVLPLVLAAQLKVTSEHPFLVNNKWISASDLKVGDKLSTIEGKTARITGIKFIPDKAEVYNLEAGIYHDFVVEDGVIVHNSNQLGICFSGDSLITMANGEQKQIKDIREGESVLSWDFKLNKTIASRVSGISRHLSSDIYLINGKIRVTSGHPFWTLEAGWSAIDDSEVKEHPELKLSELKTGNHLLDYSGNYILIESIVKENATEDVFNLEDVGDNHNYFADDVLVHNQGNPCGKYIEKPFSETVVKCKCGVKSSTGVFKVEPVIPNEQEFFNRVGPLLADASYRANNPQDLVRVQEIAYKYSKLIAATLLKKGTRNYEIVIQDISNRAMEGLLASDYLINYNPGSQSYFNWIYGRLDNFIRSAKISERVYTPPDYTARIRVEGKMQRLGDTVVGTDGKGKPVTIGALQADPRTLSPDCEAVKQDLLNFIDRRVKEYLAVVDPSDSALMAEKIRNRKLLVWELYKKSLLQETDFLDEEIGYQTGLHGQEVGIYRRSLQKFIRTDTEIQLEIREWVEVEYHPPNFFDE